MQSTRSFNQIPYLKYELKTLEKGEDENEKKKSFELFCMIPSEVFVEIFTFLNAVELNQVRLGCKTFYTLAYQAGSRRGMPFRTERPDENIFQSDLKTVIANVIRHQYRSLVLVGELFTPFSTPSSNTLNSDLQRSSYLEKIAIRSRNEVSPLLFQLLSHSPELKEFTAKFSTIKAETHEQLITSLIRSCPKLQFLRFSPFFTNKNLIQLSQLKNLSVLNLKNCKFITDSGLIKFGTQISRLTSLDLRKTSLTGEWLEELAPHCIDLSTLKIGGINHDLTHFYQSRTHLKALTHLQVFIPSVNFTLLNQLKSFGNTLIGLKIGDISHGQDLTELWPICSNLQRLKVPYLCKENFNPLLEHCKGIKKLYSYFQPDLPTERIMAAYLQSKSLVIKFPSHAIREQTFESCHLLKETSVPIWKNWPCSLFRTNLVNFEF